MKHTVFAIFFILALLFFSSGYADESISYVQEFEPGTIDWTSGIMSSKGVAFSNKGRMDDLSISLPLTDAIKRARGNLVKLVYQVRIDGSTLLKEIAAINEVLHEKIVGMVESALLTEWEKFPDGSVEALIELPFSGGFSQLFLPSEITRIESIKPMTPMDGNLLKTSESNLGMSGHEQFKVYSGLVVDARGLKAVPALAPRILDERGEQVYGSLYVSREFAEKYGVCIYMKSVEAALKNSRVADNPLFVKGLRANGPALADIVISNTDASKIRGSSKNLTFLKKCRVIMILD